MTPTTLANATFLSTSSIATGMASPLRILPSEPAFGLADRVAGVFAKAHDGGNQIRITPELRQGLDELFRTVRGRSNITLLPEEQGLLNAIQALVPAISSVDTSSIPAPPLLLSALQIVNLPTTQEFERRSEEFTSLVAILTGYGNPARGAIAKDLVGTVTEVRTNREGKIIGFYFQQGDSSATERRGVYIYLGTEHSITVTTNHKIKLSGRIIDFRPKSPFDPEDTSGLLNVQIMPFKEGVEDLGETKAPAPVILQKDHIRVPKYILQNSPNSPTDIEAANFPFDPANDGLAWLTTLKGQLVTIPDPVVCGAASYGYISVISASLIPDELRTADGGVRNILNAEGRPQYAVPVFRMRAPTKLGAKVGDRLNALTGVVDYSDGNFNLITQQEFKLSPQTRPDPKTHLTEKADHLRTLYYNVEMQSLHNETGMAQLADHIKLADNPELIGLEEWSDDSGEQDDGTATGKKGLQRLVEILEQKTGKKYAAVFVDPINNADGGKPGANIRNVILYRTDVEGLEFHGIPGATATTKTTVVTTDGRVQLSHNPGRIDPQNQAFSDSRKPLVAQFTFNGKNIYMSALHFKSKRGDAPLVGHVQPPVRPSEKAQAEQMRVVRNFFEEIHGLDPSAILIAGGDLNADVDSSTINELGGSIMVDARQGTNDQSGKNSYVYQGRGQDLDHIFVSAWLFANSHPQVEFDILLLNAHLAHGHPDRLSDHNPVLVRIHVPRSPPS